jgi:hypothetical protein
MVAIAFQVIPVIASMIIWLLPQLLGWSSVRVDEWLITAAATFLFQLVAACFGLVAIGVYGRLRKVDMRQLLGLRKIHWRDPLFVIGGYVAYAVLFTAAALLLEAFSPIDVGKEQALGFDKDSTGWALVMAFAGLVIIPPLIEEVVFRGFLYGTLRAHAYGVAVATVVTSICFAALHLSGSTDNSLLWIAFFDTFVLSVVMCVVREKTGAIWASIGIHALKNGFVFVNLFLLGNS